MKNNESTLLRDPVLNRAIPIVLVGFLFSVGYLLGVRPLAAQTQGVSGAQPGRSDSRIISIVNLENVSGQAALDFIDYGPGRIHGSRSNSIHPNGVAFFSSSQIPQEGIFSGVLKLPFSSAAAVLTINQQSRTADVYPGFTDAMVSNELYGPILFNNHYAWRSILYCQNTAHTPTTVEAFLYQTGHANPLVTLISRSLEAGRAVSWDIVNDPEVQSQWPGGNEQFGYVLFKSDNPIACVVENQRTNMPYVQSQYNAISEEYASQVLYVPIVYHGHGTSSSDSRKDTKWNTGVSIVNINNYPISAKVTYSSSMGGTPWTKVCYSSIAANSQSSWYLPQVGTSGSSWNCGGPLYWKYPGGPTYGSVKVEASGKILAVSNSNRYDLAQDVGAGYTSIAGSSAISTNNAVCPIAFNQNPADGWLTGIRVMNVGPRPTNITLRMVRANVNPEGLGNSRILVKGNVSPETGVSFYFPQEPDALKNFEGAAFVSSSDSPILVTSTSSNYYGLSAAGMYDCLNYGSQTIYLPVVFKNFESSVPFVSFDGFETGSLSWKAEGILPSNIVTHPVYRVLAARVRDREAPGS